MTKMKRVRVPRLGQESQSRSLRLFFLLFLTFLQCIGLVTIGTGIWFMIQLIPGCSFMDQFRAAIVFFLGEGLLSILISISGVVLTMKHHKIQLHFYIFGFLIVVILEISVAVIATLDYNNLNSKFKNELKKSVSMSSDVQCWETLQEKFECCGARNYNDWVSNSERNISYSTTILALDSCTCSDDFDECTNVSHLGLPIKSSYVFSLNCYDAINSKIKIQCTFFRIFCPFVAVTQFISLLIISIVITKMSGNNAVHSDIKKKYVVHFTSPIAPEPSAGS